LCAFIEDFYMYKMFLSKRNQNRKNAKTNKKIVILKGKTAVQKENRHFCRENLHRKQEKQLPNDILLL